ncbi:MAG: DUF58 domain-containing protein [Elusimicrobia bacterium]|nr:DUF58 domain-containing protein [Elusimicrobiota bacterium]MBP9127214.1 DUF58 domain-containing protein [Elusimicrobiota bacterium]MBP9699007.1 DUF58 domain-containing protein [Elusimicrobiota bacterium]
MTELGRESKSLDLSWLARLGPARFFPRGSAEGPSSGRYTGSRRGQAGEFVDRRAYSPGDDHRRIDWKFYARSDRWTVREEREESHLRAVLLIDVSRSMTFSGAHRNPKSHFAMHLSAGLAHVFRRCQESFGWGFFEQTLLSYQPPRRGDEMWSRFLFSLQNIPIGHKTSFAHALGSFVQRARGRGAVIVVSDFLGPLEDVFGGFRLLTTAWRDVCALQILDPVELDLSLGGGAGRIEDLESSDSLNVDLDTVHEAYRSKMENRQLSLTRGLAALSVDYHLCRTDRPVDAELSAFLRRRAGRR